MHHSLSTWEHHNGRECNLCVKEEGRGQFPPASYCTFLDFNHILTGIFWYAGQPRKPKQNVFFKLTSKIKILKVMKKRFGSLRIKTVAVRCLTGWINIKTCQCEYFSLEILKSFFQSCMIFYEKTLIPVDRIHLRKFCFFGIDP